MGMHSSNYFFRCIMKRFATALIISIAVYLTLLSDLCAAELSYEPRPVVEIEILNDDDLALLREGRWLLFFYAPKCELCIRLEVQIDFAKSEIDREGQIYLFGIARFNVSRIPRISQRFKTAGFDLTPLPATYLGVDGDFEPFYIDLFSTLTRMNTRLL